MTLYAVFHYLHSTDLIKSRDWRSLQHQEVKMKLITRFELATKSKTELYALLREVFNELVRSEADAMNA